MAPSTARAYAAGVTSYRRFMALRHATPFPVQPNSLLDFVAFISGRSSLGTLRVYIQGLRHHHTLAGLPLHPFHDPRLALVLQGVAREHATHPPAQRRERHPLAANDLLRIQAYLGQSAYTPYDRTMLWSALTLAFYGFLRVSEYTSRDPARMLTRERVAVNSDHVRIAIPYSKTAQLGEGGDVVVGATADATCPVRALRAFLQIRQPFGQPLYAFADGRPLQPAEVNRLLGVALPGLPVSSHSLRIGAATEAGKRGLPGYAIKAAGRWRSEAFHRYVRQDEESTMAIAKVIATPQAEAASDRV